jgi:hypothetical protein
MRSFSVPLFILLAIVMLLGPGCYTLATVNSPTEQGIEMSNAKKATTTAHFQRSEWVNHFIFGLVTSTKPDMTKMIANEVQMKGGKSAVNVTITYEATFVQGLLNIVTFGIYNPFTLTIEGDVVK